MDDEHEHLKKEISEIIEQRITKMEERIVDKILEELESRDKLDPFANLSQITQEAMNQVKRELAEAIEEGNSEKIESIRNKEQQMEKSLEKIESIVEQIKTQDQSNIPFENPLYPKKKIHQLFPWLHSRKSTKRSSRSWLALLLAGVGLGLIFTGIGEASSALQSIQGSLILGTIILVLLAWLEKRKVFSLLGQE